MKYRVCLSFAREDREYVSQVATALKRRKVEVFYDRFEAARLWGKNLYTHLAEIFEHEASFCVMFISASYVARAWPNHERESAQARALVEQTEYILPARFDDTQVPGLLKTVGYIDLRVTSPEDLAELICQKIQHSMFDVDQLDDKADFTWHTTVRYEIDGEASSIRTFQHVPIGLSSARLVDVVERILNRFVSDIQRDGSNVFWTNGDDRKFDRIYATTSVLYAICQLGVNHDQPMVAAAIQYLQSVTTPSIDDRAGSIFLMVINRLEQAALSDFLANLANEQIRSESNANLGSFLLELGPSTTDGRRENWERRKRDGASFHACHIADALLHIPDQLPTCREESAPILAGIREYLIRSFRDNNGWLPDLRGQPTVLTLYAYSVCPALRIPLPRNWREVAEECCRLTSRPNEIPLKRFYGVLSAVYAGRSINDRDFSATATAYITEQLSSLPNQEILDGLSMIDAAALLRALVYGVDWLDRRLLASMTVRATTLVGRWTE